jgi:hypothetical protein
MEPTQPTRILSSRLQYYITGDDLQQTNAVLDLPDQGPKNPAKQAISQPKAMSDTPDRIFFLIQID